MLLEHAARTIHDRPRVETALSSGFRKNMGGQVGLPYELMSAIASSRQAVLKSERISSKSADAAE